MAGTTDSGDDGIISGINITPLVDVVLVLLIIFIVTASFLLRSSIPIELPKASTAEQSAAGLMVIGIRKDGQLLLNGRKATVDDIPPAVADARAKRSDPSKDLHVFISADVGATYGTFAAVVDRLRLEGVTQIAMDTQPVADGTAVEGGPATSGTDGDTPASAPEPEEPAR